MFEHKSQRLISRQAFFYRILTNFGVTLGLVGVSLLIGTAGFYELADLSWDDALLNAAMLLSGMGPVDKPTRIAGKMFASFYALYSGLVLILVTGILLAPFVHRFMHRFHIDDEAG